MLTEELGSDYLNGSISFKPWPSCRATHHGIEGLLQLREAYKFTGDEIASIELGLNHLAEQCVAQPRDKKWDPKDPVVARFSLPYVVAVAAQHGRVAIGDMLPKAFDDPAVRRIMGTRRQQ